VTRARGVWWLQVAVGGVGATATFVALGVAVTRVNFSGVSVSDIVAACRSWAFPDLRPASVAVLAVGSLSLAAMVLIARSALRQLRATRRFRRRLSVLGPLPGVPCAHLIADERPQAFCVGLLRPRVYVSDGAWRALGPDERAAVLAHELHHADRRDPLRLLVARALAEGLFFLPAVRTLAERYAALAELAADEAAVRATQGARALASALLTFDAHPSPAVIGIAPERVDHLMGRRAGWELPVLMLLGPLATVGLLVAVTLRLSEATAHGSIALPALMAQACMLLMAMVPVVFGAAAVLGGRRLARRR